MQSISPINGFQQPSSEEFYFRLFCIIHDLRAEHISRIKMDNSEIKVSYSHLYHCDSNDNVWMLLCNISNNNALLLHNYMIAHQYTWKQLYFDKIRRNCNIFHSYMIWLQWKSYLEIHHEIECIPTLRLHTVLIIKYDLQLGLQVLQTYLDLLVSLFECRLLSETTRLISSILELHIPGIVQVIDIIITVIIDNIKDMKPYLILSEIIYPLCVNNNFHYPCIHHVYRKFIDKFNLKSGPEWLGHICNLIDRVGNNCEHPLIVYYTLLYGLPIQIHNESSISNYGKDTRKRIYALLHSARTLQFDKLRN